MLFVASLYTPLPSKSRKNPKIQKQQFFPILALNPILQIQLLVVTIFVYTQSMMVYALVAHLQDLTLSVWQCWSPIYNVSVSSRCGEYHPLGLTVASLHKSKQITIITTIIDLSNLNYFHLHNFNISVKILVLHKDKIN